jgi:hypothetical protein
MGDAILRLVSLAGVLLGFAVMGRAVYAMFKAAANRKPGVGYPTAMDGLSLMFRQAIYTPEGLKWSMTYRRCVLGFFAIMAVLWMMNAVAGK